MIICVQRDHTSSFVDWFSSNSQPLLKTGKCSQDLPDVNSFSGTAFDADLSTGSQDLYGCAKKYCRERE